jgi:hypothetical protein
VQSFVLDKVGEISCGVFCVGLVVGEGMIDDGGSGITSKDRDTFTDNKLMVRPLINVARASKTLNLLETEV